MRIRFLLSGLLALVITGCSIPAINTTQSFQNMEKEYKSFKTQALSDAYVSRMFNKFLITSPNPAQVIRQLEFARYLKDVKSDTSYFNSLKNIITNDSSIYTKITTTSGVPEKKSAEPASFGVFVDSLNPNQNGIVTSGLVLNLDAGNTASYPSPFTGTAWTDLSSFGNIGILTNGPSYSSVNNGVIVFDGINDYVRIPQSNNYKFGTGGFTIDMWFNLSDLNDTNAGYYDRLFFMGNDVFTDSFSLHIQPGGKIVFRSNSGDIQTSNQNLTANTWYNFTFTRTSNTVKMYVNGALDRTTTWANSDISAPGNYDILIFNAEPISDVFEYGGSAITAGKVGSVKLYNKELISTEVSQNFDATKSRFGM